MANRQAFTLSELLVSLAVLGLIAAFAIPKILNAVTERTARTAAIEAGSTLGAALVSFYADKQLLATTSETSVDILTKVNYAREVTGVTLTAGPGQGVGSTCDGTTIHCVAMHTGTIIATKVGDQLKSMTPGRRGTVVYLIDPDGTGPNDPVQYIFSRDSKLYTKAHAAMWASTYDLGNGDDLDVLNDDPLWYSFQAN
jgi:prepilin-type N-terminal cleavage/methylation domain-containing protein